MTARREAGRWLGAFLIITCFAAPLFLSLGRSDLGNDESIYAYAVDRILETGDWLTPRLIPNDEPFFEKPPLKFWLVAGGMRAGILPHDEWGFRIFDATFGGAAFVYVYLLGCLLAGPICGVASVLLLFTFDPLVFEHGLRSHTMEAPLVLSYAATMYHFARWYDGATARVHVIAICAFFFLAFMTKFVAALFIPAICAGGVVLGGRKGLARLRADWRAWLWCGGATLLAAAPWFVYQTARAGKRFWEILLGAHVYQRFTSSLDVEHLQPWSFYFAETWHQLRGSGIALLIALGVLALLVAALWERRWLAQLILLWFILPMLAISAGTSKVLHYAYPFWPPLALGGGFVIATVFRRGRVEATSSTTPSRAPRTVAAAVALVYVGIMLATAVIGPWRIGAADLTLLSNSSVVRPAVVALVWIAMAVWVRSWRGMAVAVVALLLLPLGTYALKLQALRRGESSLQAARQCSSTLARDGGPAGRGTFVASGGFLHHAYYYYLRKAGPWTIADHFDREQVLRHLMDEAVQRPVLISSVDFASLIRDTPSIVADALLLSPQVVIVLPGPYRACRPAVETAGAKPAAMTVRRSF